MVIVQLSRRTGRPCCRLSRNFSARSKIPMSFASGTGGVPLGEIHADVEIERPVSLAGDHASIQPEIAEPLVEAARNPPGTGG